MNSALLDLETHAAQAEVITWPGREALRLEDGLGRDQWNWKEGIDE